MNILMLAVAAALGGQAATPTPLQVEIPLVEGASADATCGGREALVQQATCVQTTQAGISGLLDRYDAAFQTQGWLAADGRANLVVYVKRKPAGGCDAFQVLAFTQVDAAPAPAAPAWLAFAAIPGDICAAQPAAPVAPAPAQ